MYAIWNACYGIPLTEEHRNAYLPAFARACEDDDELLTVLEDEDLITTYYTGSGDESPVFVGVEIGGFDECEPLLFMTDLVFRCTPKDANFQEQAREKIEALAAYLDQAGFPDAAAEIRSTELNSFLLASTS